MKRFSASLALIASFVGAVSPAETASAKAPLRVHPDNSRYFTDGTMNGDGDLKAVYLTGSHTWTNLIDRGPSDPPRAFDFDGYLDFLQRHNHNFIRLWSRHVSWYNGYGEGELHAAPLPWVRTGPGKSLDGKPKFDLTKLDEAYFKRLRARIISARDRGIYVSVMLFGGKYECQGGWRGNPFHSQNNMNGIDGDPKGNGNGLKIHTLELEEINRLQEAYVRKVIDSVNDLDNVLYEISNEGDRSSLEWQRRMIDYIREYQASQPRKHPVGMTALYIDQQEENDQLLRASAADWISPLTDAAGVRNIAAADGAKISIVDSDHWFVKEIYGDAAFGREWVWKAFCRGHNPILMEHLPPLSFVDQDYPVTIDDEGYSASRSAMGHTRQFAERIRLSAMVPRQGLSSTRYCLASGGKEYLVYQPDTGKEFSVALPSGFYRYEWFDVLKGRPTRSGMIESSGSRNEFRPITTGEAVLHLKAAAPIKER